MGPDAVAVKWHFERSGEPMYRLLVCVVNVVGIKFKKEVNSNIRYFHMNIHINLSFKWHLEICSVGKARLSITHRSLLIRESSRCLLLLSNNFIKLNYQYTHTF